MNDFKAYASRRLSEAGLDGRDRKRWARHGSTRYLWKPEHVEAAIRYVVYEQGEPMAVYENVSRALASGHDPNDPHRAREQAGERLGDRAGGGADDRALPLAAQTPRVEFEIFEPQSEKDVPPGTVNRAKATCLCCGTVLPPARVRAQLREQRGGADVVFDANGKRIGGSRLLAVVTVKPNEQGRHYRLPTDRDYVAVQKAMKRLAEVAAQPLPNGLSPVPDEPTPVGGGSGAGRAFSVQKYGMMTWGELFTARQKTAIVDLLEQKDRANPSLQVLPSLALAIGRCSEQASSLVRWRSTVEAVAGTFGRQACP